MEVLENVLKASLTISTCDCIEAARSISRDPHCDNTQVTISHCPLQWRQLSSLLWIQGKVFRQGLHKENTDTTENNQE